MGSYWAHGPKIYPKAHENPRAFSCIFGKIFLESSIQCPWGVGLHHLSSTLLMYNCTWLSCQTFWWCSKSLNYQHHYYQLILLDSRDWKWKHSRIGNPLILTSINWINQKFTLLLLWMGFYQTESNFRLIRINYQDYLYC